MDGIIVVDKSKEVTSNDVVNKVKRMLNVKVGHTGTLDPNATGVLPLLLGKGTKFSKYLINHDKKYIATLKLGVKTTTADVEGEIIERKDVDENIFDEKYISEVLKCFVGNLIQTPPIYSAIKVKGKKLYEYARNNIEIEIPKRNIEIYSINLIEFNKEDKTLVFEVECSKGTYIRSLCEDIAEKLGTIGYMKELRRTKVGEFCLAEAVTIEELENNKANEIWLKNKIISLEDLLKNNGCINLKKKEIQKFFNGVKLKCNNENGIYKIFYDGIFFGTGVVESKLLKRDIVIVNDNNEFYNEGDED